MEHNTPTDTTHEVTVTNDSALHVCSCPDLDSEFWKEVGAFTLEEKSKLIELAHERDITVSELKKRGFRCHSYNGVVFGWTNRKNNYDSFTLLLKGVTEFYSRCGSEFALVDEYESDDLKFYRH